MRTGSRSSRRATGRLCRRWGRRGLTPSTSAARTLERLGPGIDLTLTRTSILTPGLGQTCTGQATSIAPCISSTQASTNCARSRALATWACDACALFNTAGSAQPAAWPACSLPSPSAAADRSAWCCSRVGTYIETASIGGGLDPLSDRCSSSLAHCSWWPIANFKFPDFLHYYRASLVKLCASPRCLAALASRRPDAVVACAPGRLSSSTSTATSPRCTRCRRPTCKSTPPTRASGGGCRSWSAFRLDAAVLEW